MMYQLITLGCAILSLSCKQEKVYDMMTSPNGNIFCVTVLSAGNSSVSPVNSPHKGQWRGSLVFSLICAWTNGWINNRDASDLRRHCAHYDVIVMRMVIMVQYIDKLSLLENALIQRALWILLRNVKIYLYLIPFLGTETRLLKFTPEEGNNVHIAHILEIT